MVVNTVPPGAVMVVVNSGTSRLMGASKELVVCPDDTGTLEYCIEETVNGGACIVTVELVPGATSMGVMYAGSSIVVGDGRPLGASTKRHGGVHWAGVPLYT